MQLIINYMALVFHKNYQTKKHIGRIEIYFGLNMNIKKKLVTSILQLIFPSWTSNVRLKLPTLSTVRAPL